MMNPVAVEIVEEESEIVPQARCDRDVVPRLPNLIAALRRQQQSLEVPPPAECDAVRSVDSARTP